VISKVSVSTLTPDSLSLAAKLPGIAGLIDRLSGVAANQQRWRVLAFGVG